MGRLPEVLTLMYISSERRKKSVMVSALSPIYFKSSLIKDAPYLFKEGKGSQWSSTFFELLATLAALHSFGWATDSLEGNC